MIRPTLLLRPCSLWSHVAVAGVSGNALRFLGNTDRGYMALITVNLAK